MISNIFKGLIWVTVLIGLSYSCKNQNKLEERRILVFSKTAGFRHASIPAGQSALFRLGHKNNIRVDTTENSEDFNYHNLKKYDAVIFLSTTGNVLDSAQQEAFQDYIHEGGGFLGIHAASDTEYEWPWYTKLVGGQFKNHPAITEATLEVKDHNHKSTSFLEEKWTRTDEWYNFKNLNSNTKLLITVDDMSYEGGTHYPYPHPISWYHNYHGGRSFYTAMGHTSESFDEPLFMKHILGGLEFVMGRAQ